MLRSCGTRCVVGPGAPGPSSSSSEKVGFHYHHEIIIFVSSSTLNKSSVIGVRQDSSIVNVCVRCLSV